MNNIENNTLALNKDIDIHQKLRLVSTTYKYRIYPSNEQIEFFHKSFGCERFLYNHFAGIQLEAFKSKSPLLSNYSLDKLIPKLKKEKPWLKEVNSQSLQKVTKDLKKGVNTFFRKCKKGEGSSLFNFKKKNSFKQSFGFPSNGQVKFIHNYKIKKKNKKKICYISIPKLKTPIKLLKHRNFDQSAVIKNVTITREADGYYMALQCEIENEQNEIKELDFNNIPKNLNIVGGDLGVVKLFTTSDGDVFSPIHPFHTNQVKLKELQQGFNQAHAHYKAKEKEKIKELKEKNEYDKDTFYFPPSKRYLRLKSKVRKLHQKIARIRHNYLHNISKMLVDNYDHIILENLDVKKMTQSNKGTLEEPGENVSQKSKLNKSILGQGWGILKKFIDYKLEWKNGYKSIKIPPYNTSKTCVCCLYQSNLNRESQAIFDCIKCDNIMNADVNASFNIIRLGLIKMGFSKEKSHEYVLKLINFNLVEKPPWAMGDKKGMSFSSS